MRIYPISAAIKACRIAPFFPKNPTWIPTKSVYHFRRFGVFDRQVFSCCRGQNQPPDFAVGFGLENLATAVADQLAAGITASPAGAG